MTESQEQIDGQIASFLLEKGSLEQNIDKEENPAKVEEPQTVNKKADAQSRKPVAEKPMEEFASIQPEGGKKVKQPVKMAAEAPKPLLVEKTITNQKPSLTPKNVAELAPAPTPPYLQAKSPQSQAKVLE